MGTVIELTVPLAEVAGLVLALRLAHDDNAYHNCDIEIYTDNQSALRTMQNPCQASGQFLMEEVINLLKRYVPIGLTMPSTSTGSHPTLGCLAMRQPTSLLKRPLDGASMVTLENIH